MAAAPLLQDPAPRAQQLADLGTAGLEALQYLEKHEAASGRMGTSQAGRDRSGREAGGLVRFTVLGPLGDLVKAAGSSGTFRSGCPPRSPPPSLPLGIFHALR